MTTAPGTPTLTVAADMKPCPRATITVTPAADNHRLTIFRHDTEGDITPVRGAERQPVAGTFVAVDYEIPFGLSFRYSAIGYDTRDIPSQRSPLSDAKTLFYDGCPVAMDPTDPATAHPWNLQGWPERTHTRDMQVSWPIASDVATVLCGPRRKPASAMTVITRNAPAAAALAGLLAAPVIHIRCDGAWRWRAGYFAIGEEVPETPHHPYQVKDQVLLWELPLIPAAPPPAALFVPVHDWNEVVQVHTSWDTLVAVIASWNALVLNPKP